MTFEKRISREGTDVTIYVRARNNRLRIAVVDGIWITIWRMTLVCGPIAIINKLILGHAMPMWAAGAWGLVGGILGLWIAPWLLRWRYGLMIWLRVCNRLMKGY